jgi:hypothetical protein
MVILFQPDYQTMTTRQMDALVHYLSRGGTLVFADPIGIEATMNTPLRKLLPVSPLRVRKLDVLNAMTDLGGTRLTWEDGADFLEASPRGDGVTTLYEREFPIVRWRKYGLGTVGACMINPSLSEFKQSPNFDIMWKHLLHEGGQQSYASSQASLDVTNALDAMTGLEIPRPDQIRKLVIVYLVIILAFISVGILSRKRVFAWVTLAAAAGVSTIALFIYAERRSTHDSPRLATLIEFVATGTEEASGEQLASLYSKGELTTDIVGRDVDTRLRSVIPPQLPTEQRLRPVREATPAPNEKTKKDSKKKASNVPDSKDFVDRGRDQIVRDPVKVDMVDGVSRLPSMHLRAKASRFYSALYMDRRTPPESIPAVQWTAAGPAIAPWAPPADLVFTDAAFMCEYGSYPMLQKDGKLQLTPGKGGAQIRAKSRETAALQRFLETTAAPAPMIVFFADVREDPAASVPADFKVLGKRAIFFPVQQDLGGESMLVPHVRMRLLPGVDHARQLMTDGTWRKLQQNAKESTYRFYGFLPAGLSRLQVDSLDIRFVGENRGRNLTFSLAIEAADGALIEPTTRADDVYSFAGLAERGVFDVSDGHFGVVLKVATIKDVKGAMERMRVNAWQVREFSAAVRGTLPSQYQGRL